MFVDTKYFVFLQPVNGIADLAQLAERKLPKLQSACLTSRRSLVRTQQFPQKKDRSNDWSFLFIGFIIFSYLIIFRITVLPLCVMPLIMNIP